MTIQYLSDLHLEYADNEAWLRKRQIRAAGDVLVAAGDMFYLDDSCLGSNFFCKWAADNFEQVLIVPGNHEYYGGCDVMGAGHSWQYKIKSNVGYYQNNTVRIGDTDFILSTLWSYIPPDRQSITEFFLNDFHRIRYRGRLLTPEDFNREHVRCKTYIRRAVAGSTARRRVVVTHHVPTRLCSPRKFTLIRGGRLESAFVTDMTHYISGAPIDCWIYGHSHSSIDAVIGGTKVVSNQLGYVGREENKYSGFEPVKTITI